MTIIPIVLFTIVGFALQKMEWSPAVARISKSVLLFLMSAAVLALAINGIRYLLTPAYYNLGEENVAAVAAYWLRGHPIYQSLTSADRYSLLYGPLPTLINALFQKFGSNVFFASKLPGVLSLFLTLLLMMALIFRKRGWSLSKKLIILSTFAAFLIVYFNISFWDRPDSYEFWLTLLGLLLADSEGPEFRTAIVLGVIAACLANCKANALLTVIPLFAFYLERRQPSKMRRLVGAFTVAMAAAGLVVFLIPGVSLVNYLSILILAAHQPFSRDLFCNNVVFVLPLFALLWLADFSKRYRATFYVLAICIALTIIAASKVGAGRHHLLPFLPLFFYFAAISEELLMPARRTHLRRYAVCCFLGMFWLVPQFEGRMLNFYRHHGEQAVRDLQDLQTLEKKYPGPKSMGMTDFGASYSNFDLYYFTPELVRRGGRLLVDIVAMIDFRKAGLKMPAATYQALANCDVRDFVLPATGKPWVVYSTFRYHPAIFPKKFREIFSKNYKRIATVGPFALYRCYNKNNKSVRRHEYRARLKEYHSHS